MSYPGTRVVSPARATSPRYVSHGGYGRPYSPGYGRSYGRPISPYRRGYYGAPIYAPPIYAPPIYAPPIVAPTYGYGYGYGYPYGYGYVDPVAAPALAAGVATAGLLGLAAGATYY